MRSVVYPFVVLPLNNTRSLTRRKQKFTPAELRIVLRVLTDQTMRLQATHPHLVAPIVKGFARLLNAAERER